MESNSSNQAKPYKFILLKEEINNIDFFEDKTHENVANSIDELINAEEGGVTIALEGSWGSGKSTVISILKEKLSRKDSVKLIQFDAWAHQGDPLRRIFLEALIEEIKNAVNNSKLETIKNKISNREKTIKIKTTRSVTNLGKVLAVATFFVPLGLALMSLVKNLGFSFGEKPHFLFIFSLIFIVMPLVVLLGNLLKAIIKRKESKIFDHKNWAFLKEDSEQNIVQEVSEEDERSSIEFEKYFKDIIELFFEGKSEDARLIIVIDNLDRVDPKDSLTIWSTLQTFLQQRANVRRQRWFKKIWIIVPYDPDGLASPWASHENTTGKNTNDEIAKAFFDKNFQLRFEVPKPVLSGWLDFAQRMGNDALISWSFEEKRDAIDMLMLTRENINDIPTPREIKNYINQIALLVCQSSGNIPVSSVGYYVILRQLKNINKKEIPSKLVLGEIPERKHLVFLPSSIRRDLAGLVFGVTPDKGNQLLLEPEIQKVLIGGKSEEIKKLIDIHGKDFWNVFKYHIQHCSIAFSEMLDYSQSIYHGMNHEDNIEVEYYKNKLREVIKRENVQLKFSGESEIDAYSSIVKLYNRNDKNDILLTLYYKTLRFFQTDFPKDDKLLANSAEFFKALTNELLKFEIPMKPTTTEFPSVAKFIQWAKLTVNTHCWKWITPSSAIVGEISNKVQQGVKVEDGVLEAIKYSLRAKVEFNWNILLENCKKHIEYNNANYANHSDEVFEIITLIGLNYTQSISKIKPIIISGHYQYLFNQRFNFIQNLLHVAIICGYVLGSELQKTFIQQHHNSQQGFERIRTFWKTADASKAAAVLSYLKPFGLLNFIWKLAEDSENKLAGDIIAIVTKNEDCNYMLDVENGLNKIELFRAMNSSNTEMEILTKKIVTYSKIEQELLGNQELDVVNHCEVLTYIIAQTNNSDLVSFIANKIKPVSKEVWSKSLDDDTYLTSLALELKKKNAEFELSHDFLDALFEFCQSTKKVEKWQVDNWQKLVGLLSLPYEKEYRKEVSDYFIEQKGIVSEHYYLLTKNYLDKEKILTKRNLLEDIIDNYIKDEDFEQLKLINNLFEQDEIRKFYKKDKDKIKVVEDRLKDTFKKSTEDQTHLLKEIATKLNINI